MKNAPTADPAALRRAAEAQLKAKPAPHAPHAEADLRRLQHELEVHQIELEMQNQELRETEAKLVEALERYTDHFDFAPVGYFNLGADSTIKLVNLTGARLVGIERARLLGQRFDRLVIEADRRAFSEFLARIFRLGDKEEFEITLLRPALSPQCGLLEASLSPGGQECRAVLVDITERKQLEAVLRRQAEELNTRNASLAQTNELFVGRELRMIELKREINELCAKVGEAPRYPSLVPGYGSEMKIPPPPKAPETPG